MVCFTLSQRQDVYGPYELNRTIPLDIKKKFWGNYPRLSKERGCYIFGIKGGKGSTPAHVGKTDRAFKDEVFSYHNPNTAHIKALDDSSSERS